MQKYKKHYKYNNIYWTFLKTTAKNFHFVSKNTNNMTKSHTCNTIPSIPGSDLPSAPVTWMPFGKRLLTSAIEGEFKQSCVIFLYCASS